MQGGRTVQQHGVLLDDVTEHAPHLRAAPFDHALGRLDVGGQLLVDQLLHDERLEKLERHDLGQAALVEAQGRAGHDDRTARVVDALAEQVLAEAALLALEHVGQRLERPVARAGHGAPAAAVVEQGVDGLLEHPLLVVDDDLGGAQVEEALEPVVPVDDPAVQVVQVGGGEAAAVELHHGAQVGRDDRHGVEDHGAGLVDPATVLVTAVEARHDLEALDGLLLALHRQGTLALRRVDHRAELLLLIVEVDQGDEAGDGVGAHAAVEVLAPAVDHLAPEALVLDDLADEEAGELVPGAVQDLELFLILLADLGQVLVGGALAGPQVDLLGVLLLEFGQLGLEVLLARGETAVALLVDGRALLLQLGLERGEVLVAALLVDRHDHVGSEVDDLFELLGLELLTGLGAHQQVCQPRAGATQVPDVDCGGSQLDVAHPLAANLGAGDLDATALADDALEANPLVLAAVALPVLGRAEDLLAEESVLLRLEGAVVDGLRLLHLAVGPHADAVRGGEADSELVEVVDVEHVLSWFFVLAAVSGGGRRCGARPLRRTHARGGTGRCPAPRWCGTRPR